MSFRQVPNNMGNSFAQSQWYVATALPVLIAIATLPRSGPCWLVVLYAGG